MKRVLLLGGTSEARGLGATLSQQKGVEVIASFLTSPSSGYPGCQTRIGGFGGVEGLKNYLHNEAIDLVLDLTHPYAEQMSLNAVMACKESKVPRLAFYREPWLAETGDDWQEFENWQLLIDALPQGARVFLAAGQDGLKAFWHCSEFIIFARALVAPETLPSHIRFIQEMPKVTAAEEIALWQEAGITHLVCKNSGGVTSMQKLNAARHLSLPILMLKRPPAPPPPLFTDINSLLASMPF